MHPYSSYELIIGLEVHIQLATQSKAFCTDSTAFGAAPNSQVSPVSLGHPGTLPVLNRRQLEMAVRLGLALDARINRYCHFDRKHYFYADLPKGYQITQDNQPVCSGGALEISVNGSTRRVRIHHIHMEEDAGKSIHDQASDHSLIDFNRAGVPLLEVVTEPDLRSAQEVDAFMTAIRHLARYLDISDGNMEEGSMRCDCNVSVRKLGDQKLGERCEIKNLNSMRYARKAIEYEARRQIDILEAGGSIEQQTLQFDPASGRSSPLRNKEEAHDYRYFPEPDLSPVVMSEETIAAIRTSLPKLAREYQTQWMEAFQLSAYDAGLLSEERSTAQYFEALAEQCSHYKAAANLLINKLIPMARERGCRLDQLPFSQATLIEFIALIESGKLSHSTAYQTLLPALAAKPKSSPTTLAASMQLLQSDDAELLEGLAEEVLKRWPDKVKAYRNGKKGLLGFFMGELMRDSRGRANPAAAKDVLIGKLKR